MAIRRISKLAAMLGICAVVATAAPQQQHLDAYRSYQAGQYAHDGQAVLRTAPRLVAIKPGTPILRNVDGKTLKRVRVSALPPNTYVVDQSQVAHHSLGQASAHAQQQAAQAAHAAQQPVAYYVQRQPSPAPAHQQYQQQRVVRPAAAAQHHHAKPAYRPAAPVEEEPVEDEYPSDPNPQYNFSFDVKDDELTNYQNRQEEREGGVIKGSYSVVDPDGYVRTVTYTADSKNGFQAKVVREPTDVKIKFPVPTTTEAPEPAAIYKKPAIRVQQFAQYPSTHTQYYNPAAAGPASAYSQQYALEQAQIQQQQQQPTYVVRRLPSQQHATQPRVVKVLRAQ